MLPASLAGLFLVLLFPSAGCMAPLSPMMKAAKSGDSAAVQRLLAEGADPNEKGKGGVTPLIYATASGNAAVVDMLLARGADANAKTSSGATALMDAACVGTVGMVEALLAKGADVNAKNVGGWTALTGASYYGRAASLEPLIKKGAEVNDIDGQGETALSLAAIGGHAASAKILLSNGADIDVAMSRLEQLAKQYQDLGLIGSYATQYSKIQQGIRLLKKLSERRQAVAQPAASVKPAETGMPSRMTPERESPAAARAPASDVDTPAYSAKPRPLDFALVVGIEKYSSLPEAPYAERDAQAVRKHLLALGLPQRNIVSLSGQAATRSGLQGYLDEWLPRNVKPESTVFFYYSGHGAPDPKTGEAYLVPWDGNPMFLKSSAYPLKQIYAALAGLKVKRAVVALDACFSGAGGRSVLAKGAKPLVTKVEDVVPSEGSVTVLAAASGDEITGTLDEQGHGMFTYFLLKGLAAGKRSAKALHDFLRPQVQDEARRQNREQTPALLGADLDF